MAKPNGKIPGTYVSEKELESLGELLGTMRDYILAHEARIEIIEAALTASPPNDGELIEPANDSEER